MMNLHFLRIFIYSSIYLISPSLVYLIGLLLHKYIFKGKTNTKLYAINIVTFIIFSILTIYILIVLFLIIFKLNTRISNWYIISYIVILLGNIIFHLNFFRSLFDYFGTFVQISVSCCSVYGFFDFNKDLNKEEQSTDEQLYYDPEILSVYQNGNSDDDSNISEDDSICFPSLNSKYNYPDQIDVDENSILGVTYTTNPYFLNNFI